MAVMPPSPRSSKKISEDRKKTKENISRIEKEISGIRSSKNFKLSKTDQEHYDSWNQSIEENKRGAAEIFKPYESEKDYAINWKQAQIKLYKSYLVKLVCEEKGHVEKSSYTASGSHTGTRRYCTCGRCGMMYERSLTSEEYERFDRDMRQPMTI